MNNRLRQAREERGWSQGRLIHAIRQQAASTGLRVAGPASLKTLVSRWENGHAVPDDIYRELFRAVYGLSDPDLGLFPGDRDRAPGLGIAFATTWTEAVDEVTLLWRQDVSRRSVLAATAFAAGSYGLPALRWMVSGSHETPAREGTGAVTRFDIHVIREMTRSFRTLDNAHGGGLVREQAVRYLDREVAPLLKERSFDGLIGRELLCAAAELTQLVGWMAYDAVEHGLSQRYLIQSLRLAEAGGDRSLGAEIVAAMSHQASYLGDGSTAIDLAKVAAKGAEEAGIAALAAEAAVLEAQGHAVLGDERGCAAALGRAERALDTADRSGDPQWISYFDDAYLSAKFGHCFRSLGQGRQAARFATASLQMDPSFVRGRSFNLALLAHAHAQLGEYEQAVGAGQEAMVLISNLNSARAVQYVAEVAQLVKPADSLPEVVQFRTAVAQLAA